MNILFKIKEWQKNRDEKRRQRFLKFKEERILKQKIIDYRCDPNVKWTRREFVDYYQKAGYLSINCITHHFEVWNYYGTCPYTNEEFFITQKTHERPRHWTGRLFEE